MAASMPLLRVLFRDHLQTSLGRTRPHRARSNEDSENGIGPVTVSYVTNSYSSRQDAFITTTSSTSSGESIEGSGGRRGGQKRDVPHLANCGPE